MTWTDVVIGRRTAQAGVHVGQGVVAAHLVQEGESFAASGVGAFEPPVLQLADNPDQTMVTYSAAGATGS